MQTGKDSQNQADHLAEKAKWQRIIDRLETEAKPGRLQAKHGPTKSPNAGAAQSSTFVGKLRNFPGCVESAPCHRCGGSLALQHRNHIRLGRIDAGAAWLPTPSRLCAVQHDRRLTDRKTRQQQGTALGAYRPCRWMHSAFALGREHGVARHPGDWRIHCRRQRAGAAIVKRDFIDNVSFATGAYSACVTAGSALAGLTASAAADALGGWQPALAFWAIPALLAAFLWLLRTKLARDIESNQAGEKNSAGKTHLERMSESTKTNRPIRENAQTKSPLRALLKRPSTWLVTLFMGLQSAAFYTFCNWLPGIAGAAGFSSGEAGVHLFIFQALGIVSGLLIPRFMYLRGNQVCAGILASAPLLVAALGWLLSPRLSLLWSIFGGMGQGASLVVALTLISLRGRTHAETVALSGFAQSLGYLLAACGPFVFGSLTESTQGFEAPLVFMAILATAQCALSLFAGRIPKDQ